MTGKQPGRKAAAKNRLADLSAEGLPEGEAVRGGTRTGDAVEDLRKLAEKVQNNLAEKQRGK